MKKSIISILFIAYSSGLILVSYILFSKDCISSNIIPCKYEYVGEDSINEGFDSIRYIYGKEEDPLGVYNKPNGVIPNPNVAAHIAEMILIPIYDSLNIVSQRPYQIRLLNHHIWSIQGQKISDCEGGIFSILINKDDGRVFMISHGK